MNARTDGIIPIPGQAYRGGFFVDVYMHGAERRALIAAPRAEGELADVRWHKSYDDVPGAKSYFDGLANTSAMAEAGSELAAKILQLRIGGFDDWHLPALDQLELAYFALKPTANKNACWARSGINLSALPPRWPYTPDFPMQTTIEAFREGGPEAFRTDDWYWTSTQPAAYSDCAWLQDFDDGYQDYGSKDIRTRARAVRSEPI